MSTENLPPVATAGGPPTATGGTILDVSTEAAVFDQEFLDNYDLDVEGGDEYTLGQKMVHYCCGIITQSHWIACKACLAFFAGAATSKMLTTTSKGGVTSFEEKPELILLKITCIFFSDLLLKTQD